MQHLKANTQVIVTVGPCVDVTDGFTPQTDIGLAGNEAELIKHGSTSVVDISGATFAAVTNCRGYYSLTLTTTDTNTEGMLVFVLQDDSDMLPLKQEYMVLAEAAYDSLYTAKDSGLMGVDVINIAGGLVPTPATTGIPDVNVREWLDTAVNTPNVAGTPDVNVDSINDVVASPVTTVKAVQGIAVDGVITTVTNQEGVLAVLGALADAAAAGDVTTGDTLMQYLKQVINLLAGGPGIGTNPSGTAPGNAVNMFEILNDIHDVLYADAAGVSITADVAALLADILDKVGAVAESAAAGDPSSTESLMQYSKQIVNLLAGGAGIGTNPSGIAPGNAVNMFEILNDIHDALYADAAGVSITADVAALLADILDKVGAVAEAAAAGDPSSTESVMQYVKQIVNLLAGSAGIVTNPSAAVPANGVNLFEIMNSFQARIPTAAQLAYIVDNAATGLPVTFTTSGGSTTAAVLNNVDGSSASAVDDQYNGRLLVFTDSTLKGVVTDITDYTGSTTTCVITAIPTAPLSSHAARLI